MSLLQKIIFGTEFDDNPLQTMQCLLIIYKSEKITLERLSQITGLALSTTSHIVEQLSKNKPPLVSISTSAERVKTILITKYGKTEAEDFLNSKVEEVRN